MSTGTFQPDPTSQIDTLYSKYRALISNLGFSLKRYALLYLLIRLIFSASMAISLVIALALEIGYGLYKQTKMEHEPLIKHNNKVPLRISPDALSYFLTDPKKTMEIQIGEDIGVIVDDD